MSQMHEWVMSEGRGGAVYQTWLLTTQDISPPNHGPSIEHEEVRKNNIECERDVGT